MTLKDLIANGLIKDDDKIIIAKPLAGSACDMRKGNGYNDQVLEFMNAKISSFSWIHGKGYSISLKPANIK